MKRAIVTMAVAAALMALGAQAQTRTQSVPLAKGWNAVWLEVEPEVASPTELFKPQFPRGVTMLGA